jgi:hypothetical protein
MKKNYEKDTQELISYTKATRRIEQQRLDDCEIDLYDFLILLKQNTAVEELLTIIYEFLESEHKEIFSIRERYDVLAFVMANTCLHSILRSAIDKTVSCPVRPPESFTDITDILKSKHITTEDRLIMLKKQPELFVSSITERNAICLVYRAESADVHPLFSALFEQVDKLLLDENEAQHFKTSILLTHASESINKHVLRYLTTLIKYNFGTMSLRGVIKHINRFYNELDQEGKNFIMFHKDHEFRYDI